MSSTLTSLVLLSQQIEQAILESHGEITPAVDSLIAILNTELPTKVDSYAHTLERLAHNAEFFRSKATELQKVSKGLKTAQDRLKDNLHAAMLTMGLKELVGPTSKLKIQDSPKALLILDEALIPEQFFIIERTLDRPAIKQELLMGKPVPGALLVQDQHIRIFNGRGDK